MSFSFDDKKVLLILNYGGLGGSERQALGLARYLSEKKNCQVKILQVYNGFQTEEYKSYAQYCHIQEILHYGEPYLIFKKEWSFKNFKRLKWSLQYLWKLRKGVKAHNPDIIIPFLNVPSKLGYYLYKTLPTVKITFWHQLGLDVVKGDWFETIAAYKIPFVIANSVNCFELFETQYKISKQKLNLLPQYLTLAKVDKDKGYLRKLFKVPKNAVVIGMVAQYRSDKYFDLLLDAYYHLINKLKVETHLVLLGNKANSHYSLEIYNNLNKKVKEYKLESQVSILSNIPVEDVLNIMDIGVLMSKIEGMPNSVMEYMLYELPVIATDHIGTKHIRNFEGKQNSETFLRFNLPDYVSKLEQIVNQYL